MDARTKELIAIGASFAANCQPCVQYHVAKARENRAGEEDILAAIAVGKLVRKGAAGKMDRFVSTMSGNSPADVDPKENVDECAG